MGGALLLLGITGIMMQEADPVSIEIIDACNGFEELTHLVMI